MAERDPIETWLKQIQSGESQDVEGLLAKARAELAERMQRGNRDADPQQLAAALELAHREFARFSGASKSDFLDWLEAIAQRVQPPAEPVQSDGDTLQVAGPDATLVKPEQKTFSMDSARLRIDEVLTWRFQHNLSLDAIAKRLRCSRVQAAALMRIGLGQCSSEKSELPQDVSPLDEEFAELLEQLDGGDAVDRDALSQQRPDSSGELLKLLDQIDEFAGETVTDGQTLVLESKAMAKARKTGPVVRGQPFGDYELLHVIAKGGMGVVHKARQQKLNRIVAIKTILAGQFADSDDVSRFYAEAESAAKLRHPNIVSIYEIGEHEGQHYFSMDYIEGESLAEMVRENALLPDKAAEYAQTIAKAMQYAHDQGILHRDLKPSNILVDRDNQPLITDFGLAKQVDGQSQMTMSGTVIGTPSYMPPEQAAGRIDVVDKRSDVYSLGAILFELLTGSPPFRSSSPFETIRQVLETEPIAPRMLNASIPADLETICLKCLQKEQAKRYQTAQELSDEIDRYLAGEPILARPVGHAERAWRWCRRNPKMAGLIAATVMAFLATFVTVTVAYVQTTAALAGEKVARADAEESYQQARQAVDEFFTTVSEDTLLNRYGMQPVRKALLKKALNYYQKFLAQRRDDPTIADEVAMTFYRVGFISDQMGAREEAMESLETAREMQEALVAATPDDAKRLHALSDTLVDISRIQLSGDKEAERLQNRVIELRKRMVALDENNADYARELANGHMNLGILFRERAKRSHGEALNAEDLGDTENAQRLAAEGLAHHRRAVKEYETAQKIRKQFIADGANRKLKMNYGMGFFNLGQAAADVLDTKTAEQNYLDAIGVFQELRDAANPDFVTELNLATCHRVLADHYSKHGDHDKATANYDTAEDILTPLALRNPDELNFQRALADAYKNRGQASFERDRLPEAIRRLGQALEIERGLAERNPELPRDRGAYHDTTYALAQYNLEQDDAKEAVRALQQLKDYCLKVTHGRLDEHPAQQAQARAMLAEVSIALADTRASVNELAPALADYELALSILADRVSGDSDVSQVHIDYATTLLQSAQLAQDLNQPEKAAALLKQADSMLETLRPQASGDPWFQELDEFSKSLNSVLHPMM